MIVIDESGIVSSFSAAAEQLFGYVEAEVVGCNVGMLMPDPEKRDHDTHLRTYQETGIKHVIGHVRPQTAHPQKWRNFPDRTRGRRGIPSPANASSLGSFET